MKPNLFLFVATLMLSINCVKGQEVEQLSNSKCPQELLQFEQMKGANVTFLPGNSKLQPSSSKGTDTLNIHFDLQSNMWFVNFIIFNDSAYYSEFIFDPEDDVITLVVEEGTYDLVNIFEIYGAGAYYFADYFVFNEDLTIDTTTDIFVSYLDATNQIDVSSKNQSNTLLSSLPGFDNKMITVAYPDGFGYNVKYEIVYTDETLIKFSDCSQNIHLHLGEYYFDIESNFTDWYFIDYPIQVGLNSNLSLQNNPSNFTSAHFEMNTEVLNKKAPLEFTIMPVIKHLTVSGSFNCSGFTEAFEIDPHNLGSHTIYTDMRCDGSLDKGFNMALGNEYFKKYSGFIGEFDDKIGICEYLTSNASTFLFDADDTIKLWEDVTQRFAEYYAPPDSTYENLAVATYPKGCFGEYYFPNNLEYFIIKNNTDTLHTGSNYWFQYTLDDGNYNLNILDASYTFGPYDGFNSNCGSFTVDNDTTNYPPMIHSIRILDENNNPVFTTNKEQDLELHFWGQDLVIYSDMVFGGAFYLRKPIINDSTKLYVKYYDQEEWTAVDAILQDEDSLAGSHFIADISSFTAIDTGALDVKIEVQDLEGNKTISTIQPILLFGDYTVSVSELLKQKQNSSFKIYPNPFSTSVDFELRTEKDSDVILEIRDLAGKKIYTTTEKVYESGVHHFQWNGKTNNGESIKPGVYIVSIKMDGKEFSNKILKIN
jgi:hypothetical protein